MTQSKAEDRRNATKKLNGPKIASNPNRKQILPQMECGHFKRDSLTFWIFSKNSYQRNVCKIPINALRNYTSLSLVLVFFRKVLWCYILICLVSLQFQIAKFGFLKPYLWISNMSWYIAEIQNIFIFRNLVHTTFLKW